MEVKVQEFWAKIEFGLTSETQIVRNILRHVPFFSCIVLHYVGIFQPDGREAWTSRGNRSRSISLTILHLPK